MKSLIRKCNFVKKAIQRKTFKDNLNNGVMAVEIKNTIGIGARLEWVLEILAFCDENNLRPQFRFTYPNSNTDYFNSFFRIDERYSCGYDSVKFVKIYSPGDLNLPKNYDAELTIALATYLIDKYLIIQEDILLEVNRFCEKYFSGKHVLGVHYRGTDKSAEAQTVSYEKVKENISRYREQYPETNTLFVSSDDDNFLQYIKNSEIGNLVVCRDDSYRAADDVAIHRSRQNKYDINRDAVANCLLLSRCHALIKTASILSAWSALFNPGIPLVMLSSSYDNYFPERELLKNVLYKPV